MKVNVRVAALALVIAACSVQDLTFTYDAPSDGPDVDTPIDTPMAITLVVTPTDLMIPETEQRTFTVSLSGPPVGTLPVSLSVSDAAKISVTPSTLSFSAGDWMTAKTVTVSGRDDADTVDETETVTVASGDTPTVVVNVTVDDDDGLGIMATPANGLDVTEGATAPLQVRLSAQPTSTTVVTVASADLTAATVAPTSLTFTQLNWFVDQSVVVTGVGDADTSNETTMVSLAGTGLMAVDVPINVIDDDVLGIFPSTTNLGTLPEGGASSFGVTLTQQPSADTTVTVTSSDPTILDATPSTLTFTTANWNVPQTISVSAGEDLDVANEPVTISLDSAGPPALATRVVSAMINDNDVQTIIASPIPLPLDETGSRDLNVRLAYQPSADVTLAVTSLNLGVATVSPATLTFTPANYDTNQIVTATAPDDTDAAPGMTAIRLESAADGLSTDIPVAVTDNDQLTIQTSTTAVTLSEAGMTTFGVRLTAMPVAGIVVNVNSGDPSAASVGPAALSFTTANWNNFQMVTVTGVQDLDLASEAITITLAASGLPAQTVDANITDDDMQEVLVSAAMVSVNQGGTGTVGVSLRYAPAVNVSVTVASGDTSAATVSPASLTFTPANFATPQSVTITGVVDGDTVDDTATVTASASGATSGVVTVTVNDTDALGIGTSVTTLPVTEGGTGVIGVTLTAQPAATTTVTVSSSDTGAATVSATTLTFTTANYDVVQNLTVTGVNDSDSANENVTVTFTSPGPPALTPRTVTVSVTDDDPQDILLSAATVTVAEGATGTFSVRLAAEPPGDVVVMINSGDITAASVSPGALTFTPANYATNQSVTVTGLDDIDLGNESVAITASSSGLPTKTVTATITDTDTQVVLASPTSLTIGEGASGSFGLSLSHQPASDVTVTVGPANAAVASTTPATLTFTSTNFASAQNVIVTGVEDDDAVTSSTAIGATAPNATGASVSVTVPDNDTLALVTTASALTVVEGTPGSFGVRLTAQPPGDVLVSVSSSDNTAATATPLMMTFTTANWNVNQLVTVNGTGDLDAVSETAILTVASAGLPSLTVNATITDDETQAIVTSEPAVTLGEGATATFGVHLAAMPPSDVTVTVTSADTGGATVAPATLTFTPANYASDQIVTVTGVGDVDLADESVALTLASSGLANAIVTASVTDDDTQVVQMSASTLALSEGTNGTVGVRLGFQPAANVTVTVASVSTGVATVSPATLTFTPANYATNQTVTVTAPHDADLVAGSTSVTATAPNATTGTVTVNVSDDDSQRVNFSASSVGLTEGGTTTFGVTLAYIPTADLTVTIASASTAVATVSPTTLTFTPANWDSSQTVTVTAPQDPDLAANAATITGTATGATAASLTANVTDNDTQVVMVTPGTIAVTEGATGTFGVTLGFAPAGSVTVNVSSGNTAVATVSTSTLTFTPANYNVAQNVTVTAQPDADLVNSSTTITASSASATAGTVTVNVTDDDTQTVLLSSPTLSMTEGSTTTVGVTLGFVPGASVTVTVASENTAVATVSPTTLTFTPANYNQSQTVTLTAPQDPDVAAGTTTLTASATGATSATSTVNVTDNDTQIVQLSPTTVSATEGSTAGFGVTLGFQPSANVTVTLTSGNTAVATVSPATITFTPANYNVSQNATVTAVQDIDLVAGSTSITGTAPMATSGSVTINVTDDDTQVVMVSTGTLSITEGGSATVGVSLGFVPTANVTVTLTSAATTVATVAQATLTFTPANYATNQTITINATHDANLAPGSTTVTASAPGATSGVTTINVTDDDNQIVQLSSPMLSLTEGGNTTVGVTLGFVPAADVTVTVASADTAVATVAPATLTFTPANYNQSQAVTVTAPQDLDLAAGTTTITASAPSATSGTANVNVTDNDVQLVQMNPGTVSATEGGSTSFGVTLGFVPSSNVTVTLTTGNALVATVSPATMTFTPANYNVSQSVTVTAVHDVDLVAGTTTITGTASGATSGSTTVNVTDDDTQIVQLSTGTLALTEGGSSTVGVSLGFAPAANVTVTLTSAATTVATVAPPTLTFTPANYATAQNITITATQDANLANASTTITASAPGATSGAVTTNVTDDDTQTVVLSASTVAVTEGATNTFGVTLGFVPAADVTVTVVSADTAVATVGPASLTFTPANYNVSQTVVVTAPQDLDLAANATTVTASAPSATSGSATINVTDNDTQIVQVGPGTISATEGATTSFGVTLGFQPAANVTVMVTSNNGAVATVAPASLTFTPANYNVSQNVTVTAVHDADLIAGSTTVTASAPSATSGTVTVNVTDDDTQIVVLSTGTLSVTEGASGTVGVTLGFIPSGSVSVTVASGNTALATVSPGSLTFTAGNYSVVQNVTVTGVQDVDLLNGSTSLTASASGATSGVTTVNVTDDDVQRAVVAPSALSLTEGGTAGTFGVTLAFAPASNLTVDVSSGNTGVATVGPTTLTFTPANFNVSQTVTVTPVEDANLVTNSTTITVSEGTITSGSVVVDVADNDTQVVLASPTTVGLTEGGTTMFSVTLGFQPSADVTVSVSSGSTAVATVTPSTLTFTPANYNVGQLVAVNAPQDLDLVANSTTITASAAGATPASVTVNVTDNDMQVVLMSSPTLSLIEGQLNTRGVTLGFIPSADVTVTLMTTNPLVATVSPATLTFTPANYNVSQTITINAPHDADLAAGSATINGTAPSATAGSVAVTVTDDDTQIVQVTTGTLNITEGGSGTFGVTLGFQPSANVTVTLSSGNTAVATALPTTLTFTPANYSTSQTVTVTGTQDANLVTNSTTITASAPGANNGLVTVNASDDDTQVVQTSTSTVSLTEGNAGSVGVTLGFIPTADTTVTVTSNNTAVATALPTTLTFTPANYNVSQNVAVTATQDVDLVSNSTTITFAAPGATPSNVTVNSSDDDTQVVVMSSPTLNVNEGASGTRTVTLGFLPPSNVTVTLSTTNAAVATVSPPTLTFTPANYNVGQTITISAPEDLDLVSNSATITGSAPSATSGSISVSTNDNDTQVVQASTSTLSITEGSTGTFGVTLGFIPSANVTVTLGTASAAVATASPPTLTFTPANYNVSQTVTVTGTQDLDLIANTTTITASAPSATAAAVSVTANDNDTQIVQFSTSSVSITEGSSTNVNVTLGFIPTGNVTVTGASGNTAVATGNPTSLTFTPANYNVPQAVTISAVHDLDLISNSTTITASAPGATSGSLSVTSTDDDSQEVLVGTAQLNITEGETKNRTFSLAFIPTADVTVTITSDNPALLGVNAPFTLTFTPANYNVGQTVSFTAPHDNNLAGGTTRVYGTATGATSAVVNVDVTDDDVQTVIFRESLISVVEGNTGELNVYLGFVPLADTTVTVTSGNSAIASVTPATLTFTPANYDTMQAVNVTGTQDINLSDDSVSVTGVTGTAGDIGGSATVNVFDNDTQIVQVSPATVLNVTEGSTGTFSVNLGFQPSANVTVTLTSGSTAVATVFPTSLTFTPANFATNQTVTVTATQDLDLVTNSTTITASAPNATSGTKSVNNNDNDVQTVVVTPSTLGITEGASGSFGVTLGFIPTANTTVTVSSNNTAVATVSPTMLTFTPANYNTSQTVTVSAPHDVDLAAGSATITASAAGASANVAVNVTDDDTQVVQFSNSTWSPTEGSTQSFGVRLGFQPAANVNVTVSSANTAVATVSITTFTFTPANYNTYQNFVATAVQDVNVHTDTTSINGTATGAIPDDILVTSYDDDIQDIVVNESLTNIGEGGSGSFTVRLAYQPLANTTVSISSNDTTAISVSPATLTFTPSNYSTAQTVTVSGVNDTDLVHESVTITISSAPLPSKTFTVTQYDNDLLYNNGNETGACGGTDTVTMHLLAAPLGNVTVTATVTGGTVGDAVIDPEFRFFTTANWSSSQTFTITYGDFDGTTIFELSAPGQTSRTVVATATGIACF